jgi:hypothetical protein
MSAALENRRPADVPPRGDEGDPGPPRILGPTPGEIVGHALARGGVKRAQGTPEGEEVGHREARDDAETDIDALVRQIQDVDADIVRPPFAKEDPGQHPDPGLPRCRRCGPAGR